MNAPSWIWLHIPFLVLAYMLLLGSALMSILFIIQERRIKMREALAVSSRLPPLESMDRMIYRMILYAYPLLSLGIILGGHWAVFTRKSYLGSDPTESLSFLTWAVYTVYLVLRWRLGWRGRRSTYLALAGFAIILLTLGALFVFSPLHALKGAA